MLNKKVKKLSIRQIEKLAVKNASFKNMPTTWKTLNQLNVNTHKSFMSDILPLELSIGKNLGPIDANLSFSKQGGSLGFNTTVDPLRAIFPSSAIGTPINLGASIDSTGRVTPNVGFALPFKKGGSVNKNSGLGYMLK